MQSKTFEVWLEEVDKLCTRRFGLGYHDLPDLILIRDLYDEGLSPREVFLEHVVPMAQEEGLV
jgi:hypothetical protein